MMGPATPAMLREPAATALGYVGLFVYCRMASKELDGIDRSILEILQADGRITNQSLRPHRPQPSRLPRPRRKLERSGLIAAHGRAGPAPDRRADDDRRRGHTEGPDAATHHRFEQRMQADEVVECFLVSGPCDYVLRLACRDLDHYRDLTNAWTDDLTLGVESSVPSRAADDQGVSRLPLA
jgi:DNA-binding Lrp family transcriptional regulator